MVSSSKNNHQQKRWNPHALLLSLGAALFLIGSWIFPPTRVFWDSLDMAFVSLLNNSMSLGPWWHVFWATLNIRAFDALPAVLIITVLFYAVWGLKREHQIRGCGLIATLVLIVATVPFLNSAIVHGWLDYHRDSPSLVVDGFHRLRDLVPDLSFKDQSGFSFPGDHAFILSCFAIFFWHHGKRKLVIVATLMAMFFVLPRMVSGAHWLTDTIVGGIAPALIVTGVMYATPLHQWLMALICPVIAFAARIIPDKLLIPDKGLDPHPESHHFR